MATGIAESMLFNKRKDMEIREQCCLQTNPHPNGRGRHGPISPRELCIESGRFQVLHSTPVPQQVRRLQNSWVEDSKSSASTLLFEIDCWISRVLEHIFHSRFKNGYMKNQDAFEYNCTTKWVSEPGTYPGIYSSRVPLLISRCPSNTINGNRKCTWSKETRRSRTMNKK